METWDLWGWSPGLSQEAFLLVAAAVALAAGIWIGRTTSGTRRRIRKLEEELEASQEKFAGYQTQVVSHFSRTSDLLKAMTLQYRNIYEHLAEGARELCPENALQVEPPSEAAEALAAEAGPEAPEAEEELEAEEQTAAEAPPEAPPAPERTPQPPA